MYYYYNYHTNILIFAKKHYDKDIFFSNILTFVYMYILVWCLGFRVKEADPPPCPSLYGGEYILLGGRDFVK